MIRIKLFNGQKFGKLEVVREENSENGHIMYLCVCECGNYKKIRASRLKGGGNKTCGSCTRNKWEINGEYVIGYTHNNEKFLIDLEDLDKLKQYNWFLRKGYVCNDKVGYMHRLILSPSEIEQIDHINHDRSDNRRNNLRICSNQENNRNKKSNGYCLDKSREKWIVYITINSRLKYLGRYDTKEEAIKIRKEAEELYFGEFKYREGL